MRAQRRTGASLDALAGVIAYAPAEARGMMVTLRWWPSPTLSVVTPG
jgi:hypothetical protein